MSPRPSLFILPFLLSLCLSEPITKMAVPESFEASRIVCNEAIEARVKKLLLASKIITMIHGATKKNIRIKNCRFETDIKIAKQYIAFSLFVDSEYCDFYFVTNPTIAINNKNHIININPATRAAKLCHFKARNEAFSHPQKVKGSSTPCPSEKVQGHLEEFVIFLNMPTITTNNFSVISCDSQSDPGIPGRTINLNLKDFKGQKVSVSMFFRVEGQEPDVITTPENYLETLSEIDANPQHPGLKQIINAKKSPCPPRSVGRHLDDFLAHLDNPSLQLTDFILRGCTTQVFRGFIVNLELTDYTGYEFVASMYYVPFVNKVSIIYDKQKALEHLESLEGLEHESAGAGLLEQKNGQMMTGGWTNQEDCSKFVADFEKFLGVKSGYFSGQKAGNCRTQVIRGYNVAFTLEDNGEALQISGFYDINELLPEFHVTPSDYVERVRLSQGLESNCDESDKFGISDHLNELGKEKGFIAKVAFFENIMKCVKENGLFSVDLSFNEKVCSMSLRSSGASWKAETSTCSQQLDIL